MNEAGSGYPLMVQYSLMYVNVTVGVIQHFTDGPSSKIHTFISSTLKHTAQLCKVVYIYMLRIQYVVYNRHTLFSL